MNSNNYMKYLSYLVIPVMLSVSACGGAAPASTDSTDTTSTDGSATDDGTSTGDSSATGDPSTTDTSTTDTTGDTAELPADADGDGYDSTTDCDDANAAINPGIADDCTNGIDDDCDGTSDNPSSYYVDADGDGYGDSNATAVTSCTALTGYVLNNTDCSDASATINPGATESCNGSDDNCDGSIDESGSTSTYYADTDGDGFGSGAAVSFTCQSAAPSGYAAAATDCDDSNASVYPSAPEDCGNLRDDDCDGTLDNPSSYYVDADGDGYGSSSASATVSCTPIAGSVTNNTDCKDTIATTYPGATETCNGRDDNCDGTIDEGVKTTYYADFDNDTYGNSALSQQRCAASALYKVTRSGDCNDTSNTVNPGANELCNAVDDDCNGSVDDNPDVGGSSWYTDADGDGWGSSSATAVVACSAPTADYSTDHTDCDDNNSNVSPLEPEVCDGIDNNCNGSVDDVSTTYYADADSDGFGDSATSQTGNCTAPTGYVADATDCDDDNDRLHANCVDLTDFHTSQTSLDSTTTLTNPCGYTGTYHVPIVFTSATEGWVGCANNTSATYKGVYHTTNGGDSWTKINTAINAFNLKDMTVYDIDTDTSGNVYFCGALGSSTTKVYVVKYDGASYTRFSYYGSFAGTRPNECQDIAVNDSGEMLFTSRGSTSLFFYNAAAWSNLLATWDGDAATNYSTYDVESLVDDFYVTSSATTDHPYVFTPSTTGTHSYNLTPNVVDSGAYEGLYAIHPVQYNGGTRWIASGEKQIYSTSTAVTSYNDKTGIMYYSDDDGASWTETSISVDPSNANYFANRIWDVSCHATAGVCIATGDIQTWGLDVVSGYPESTRVGGAILISADGGANWYQLLDDKMDWDTMETIQGVTWFGDRFYIMSQTAFISGQLQ